MKCPKMNHFIENKNNKDSDKILFNSPPNFEFKENIVSDFNYSYWICDTFDIYYPSKNDVNEPYLVYSTQQKIEIKIVKINNQKLIKALTEPTNYIEKLNIFYDEKKSNNYLLASDWDFLVYIWNLDDNYKFMFKITTFYTNYIYSFLIYFKLDYIITSSYGHANNIDYIKIYSLKDGKLIKNINNSDSNNTLHCLIWEKEENDIYIVACCYEKIEIYNILNGELYANLATEQNDSCGDYYYSGFISNNNEYLFTTSSEGFINIWNLYEKNLVKSIKFNSSFFKIISWSIYVDYFQDKEDSKLYENFNYYTLVCDKLNNGINIINFIFRKELENIYDDNPQAKEMFYKHEIISFFENKEKSSVKNVKKFRHPIFGESLLTSNENSNINLWINNLPLIIDIFKN